MKKPIPPVHKPRRQEEPEKKNESPLPIVSREPEMRSFESIFRQATRELKKYDPEGGGGLSVGSDIPIREIETVFITGERVKRGASKGHESTHGTPEEKAERFEEYQDFVDTKYAERSQLSWADLNRLAAKLNHPGFRRGCLV